MNTPQRKSPATPPMAAARPRSWGPSATQIPMTLVVAGKRRPFADAEQDAPADQRAELGGGRGQHRGACPTHNGGEAMSQRNVRRLSATPSGIWTRK